jgi:hypothetical protein
LGIKKWIGEKMNKKIIVTFSGGVQSAKCAIEATRMYGKKYGKENIILLNHNLSSKIEHESIKRFKLEVSNYLGIPITYANLDNYEEMTPLKIVSSLGFIQNSPGRAICSYYLKTGPFYKYLKDNCQDKENYKILYGFTDDEEDRIYRRRMYLRAMGYETEFPLAEGKCSIQDIEEVGIKRPSVYRIFRHANCIGCLKASSRSHWYCVYCLRQDIFTEALQTEEKLGYSIIKGIFLKELVPIYERMKDSGICPSDKGNNATFWAAVKNQFSEQPSLLPCECAL